MEKLFLRNYFKLISIKEDPYIRNLTKVSKSKIGNQLLPHVLMDQSEKLMRSYPLLRKNYPPIKKELIYPTSFGKTELLKFLTALHND